MKALHILRHLFCRHRRLAFNGPAFRAEWQQGDGLCSWTCGRCGATLYFYRGDR